MRSSERSRRSPTSASSSGSTEGVEGLAHVSEIQRDPKAKLDKTFQVGDPIRTRVIKIDPNERKIGLTTRDVAELTEEERTQHGGAAAAAPVSTTEPEKTES